MNQPCEICSTKILSKLVNAKYCSYECRIEAARKRSHRIAAFNVPTGTMGAISELEVAAYLLSKEYAVFRSLSPACFCDLIAFKNEEKFILEVRTAYRGDKGVISFSRKMHDSVNLFGLYIPETKEVVFINPKDWQQVLI